jgi:hypothetical protein
MPPYWRRNGAEGPDLIASAIADGPSLRTKCQQFDSQLEVLPFIGVNALLFY